MERGRARGPKQIFISMAQLTYREHNRGELFIKERMLLRPTLDRQTDIWTWPDRTSQTT